MVPRDKSERETQNKILAIHNVSLGVAMILDRLISQPSYSRKDAQVFGGLVVTLFVFSIKFY